jgi:hypothetical protein
MATIDPAVSFFPVVRRNEHIPPDFLGHSFFWDSDRRFFWPLFCFLFLLGASLVKHKAKDFSGPR